MGLVAISRPLGTPNIGGSEIPETVSDTLSLSDSVSEQSSGEVAADFVWDPTDFADMTAVRASSYYLSAEEQGTVAITTDTMPWLGASGKALRCTFPGGGTEGQSAFVLNPPSGVRQREIWAELYLRFSDNWYAATDDKSHFVMQDKPGVGNPVDRWEQHIRHDQWQVQYNNNQSSTNASPDPDRETEVWDGAWHVWRFHYKIPWNGDGAGIQQVWWDGEEIINLTGFSTSNTPTDTVFSWFIQGANADPNGTAPYRDWGQISIWNSNPGW